MKTRGFTLIELMIVVAIIAIIAAIAIPNLLISRRAANEASAVSSMRTITSAETSFQTAGIRTDATTGMGQYGTLTEMTASQHLDASLGSTSKSGYNFLISPIDDPAAPTYSGGASPANYPSSGLKTFFVDDSGVIRFRTDGTAATSADAPII